MIVCGAGPHPHQLGLDPSPELTRAMMTLADGWLKRKSVTRLISGMAAGWDHALALAAVARGLPFIAAVPYLGYESSWPAASQDLFHEVLEMAQEVRYIASDAETSEKEARRLRNRWMVDHSDRVVALWNGKTGGTADCIHYARSQRKPVDNLWEKWSFRPASSPG